MSSTCLRDKSGSSRPSSMWPRFWKAMFFLFKNWVTPWCLANSHTVLLTYRGCLPDCPTTLENTEAGAVTLETFCCKEDLCNYGFYTNDLIWTMAGLLLFSLGSVFLQTLLWWSFQWSPTLVLSSSFATTASWSPLVMKFQGGVVCEIPCFIFIAPAG